MSSNKILVGLESGEIHLYDEALNLLKRAIKLNDKYKILASNDSDFDNIRDSDKYRDLIND